MNLWIKFTFIFKTHLTTIVIVEIFNDLFNGKSSSVSNLIFIKSLSYSPILPSFVVSMSILIPSQSSLYFLILLCFHLESANLLNQKLSIVFIIFFDMSNCFTSHQIQRIYTMNVFIIINFFLL